MNVLGDFILFQWTDCRGLENPLHGKVTHEHTTYQASANYSCDTGYKFTNSVEAVLQTDCQSNQMWSMERPTCIPKGSYIQIKDLK